MTTDDRDELTRLVREISERFPDGLSGLLLDFCFLTRGKSYQSIWDMPDAELLATAREVASSMKMPVEPIVAGNNTRG
jgi:hypothetical protein